jgi:uncharacterized membrane protein
MVEREGSTKKSMTAHFLKGVGAQGGLCMSGVNVAGAERWASALGGAALTAYAIRRWKDRAPVRTVLAAAGAALMFRAATGRPIFPVAGILTARGRRDARSALGGSRVNVDEVSIIQEPAEELYAFWRNFEQLPRFMNHLLLVRQLDEQRSHWVAQVPGGSIEWDAEIISEIPHELIAWRTLDGTNIVSSGSVRFTQLPAGRGTEVRVRLQYEPPAGKVGATIARLLGREPSRTIRGDLRRFKQLVETRDVRTKDGPHRRS